MGDDAQTSQMLLFALDKEKYNVGDKATLTFPSAAGGRALVSIENGYGVLHSLWVETHEGTTSCSFEVTPQMTPNVNANISLLQPHGQTVNDLPIRLYGVIPIMVATKLEPTEPREPTKYPRALERCTSICDAK